MEKNSSIIFFIKIIENKIYFENVGKNKPERIIYD